MKRIVALLLLLASLPAFGQWPAWSNPPGLPNTGSTSITTLGTVTTGVWNGTAVPVANGGTGSATGIAAGAALAHPYILAKSGIPFIGLSSGSVSSVGAITGITALPVIYAQAYCYFPANALATSIAAGWYYCTFSSTTAGTAFLDTYTAGTPTIPGAPSAVVDGKGAFTGVTTDTFGPTITVAANTMGANGQIRYSAHYSNNNSAGTKTPRFRFGGQGASDQFANSLTTTTSIAYDGRLANRGATNAQVSHNNGITGTGALGNSRTFTSVDTTASTTIVFSFIRNTATDNVILEDFLLELISDGT